MSTATLDVTNSSHHPYHLSISRIDKSVADNINDIQASFQDDAGIVMDFIVFMSKKLQEQFFDYTNFTISEFCDNTGRNRQDLAELHPIFKNNPKANPPAYKGHQFKSVFDYVLFRMIKENIIFASSKTYKEGDKEIALKNFSILKDINLNIDRKSNEAKEYCARVSDDMIKGFLSRYYTIDSRGYKNIGKGKNGDGRKKLYVYLYRLRHILITQKTFSTILPLDSIASAASITSVKPFHKKQSVERTLNYIIKNGNLPMKFRFTDKTGSTTATRGYYIELDFLQERHNPNELAQNTKDNVFFKELFAGLRKTFTRLYPGTDQNSEWAQKEGEKDPFQRWIVKGSADTEEKIAVLQYAYNRAYGEKLSNAEAFNMVYNKAKK